MKKSNERGCNGCVETFSVVLLILACIGVLVASASTVIAGSIASCSGCHGMPPVDAAYRNISTGEFVGSHDTHSWMNGITPNCGKCHKVPTVYHHRTGNLDFVANINNSRLTARYRNVTSFPQAAVPTYDTCANVNCHFETTTPQRGNLPLYLDDGMAIQQKCSTCHSAPPTDARHAKHGQYYGDVTTGCVKCHPDHAAKAGKAKFSHATSAGQRGLVIQFTAFPNDGGSFDGDVGYPLYLYNPSRTGACTNIYCHSPGTKATSYDPPNRVADWGSSHGTSCIGCHRGDAESGTVVNTGSHGVHIGDGSLSIIDCVKCHSATVTNSRTIADMANHVNKKADVLFADSIGGASGIYAGVAGHNAKEVATAYGRCQNIYCHSNGTTTTPPFNNYTAVWGGTLATDCTGCHGGQTGSSKVLSTNNHRKHIDATFNPGVGTAIGCPECHSRTVQNNTTVAVKLNHVNGFKDYSGVRAGRIAASTCTTVYCHSSGQRTAAFRTVVPWTDTATTYDCKGCHGSYGTATLSLAPPAGSFASQYGEPNYANYSSADRNWYNSHNAKHVRVAHDCEHCHYNTSRTGTTLIPGNTLHANTQKNVSFDPVVAGNNNPAYNDQARVCSNVYCHSNGQKVGTVYANPRWGGASLNCDFCHPIAGLSGAHAIHVGAMLPTFYSYTGNHGTGTTYRYGCANCHPLDAGNFHTNGSINLALSKNEAGVGYLRSRNGATSNNGPNAPGSGIVGTSSVSIKCTAVYCHSNGYGTNLVYAQTPDWYGGSFTGDRCANCHGNYPNSTIAGSPAHYDTHNWLGSGKQGGHMVGIHYNNIYSNANGLRAAGTTDTSSHGLASNSTTISCNNCHYATVTVAYNDKSANCSTTACHDSAPRLKGDAAIASAVSHVNGRVDVTFPDIKVISKAQLRISRGGWVRTGTYKEAGSFDTYSTSLAAATYTAGTKTCSNVSCHFQRPVKWTDVGGRTTCQSCHTTL